MDGSKRSDGKMLHMQTTLLNKLTHSFVHKASGSELMTYQPAGGGHSVGGQVDLGQLLCDASNNDKHVSGKHFDFAR